MANPFINPNDPNMQTQNPDLSQILLPPAPAPSFAAHMANPANIAAIAPSVAPRSVVTPSNATPKQNSIFNAASNWFAPSAAAPPVNTAGMASMAPSPLAALPPSPMASAPAPVVNTAGMGESPLPSVTPAVSPMVQSGLQSKTQADQQKLTDLQNQGAGLNKINNGFLRGLARAGDIAGSILAPGVAAQLPGTTLHNRVLQNRQQGIVAQDQQAQQNENQQAQANAQLLDTQSQTEERKALAAKAAAQPTVQQKPENVQQQYSDAVADALHRGVDPNKDPKVMQLSDAITSLQRQPAPKDPNRDDRAIAIYSKPPAQRTPEENSYIRGYEQYVKATKTDPGVARTSVLLQMPTAVADPNTPGGLIYTTRQGAIGKGAPGGIDTQVPLAVAKDMTSGRDSQTITAGNTLNHHLDLYDKAVDAVHNGDFKLMNQIGNELGIQTGDDAQTNLALIRQGVAMEAARYYTGGVPGEAEINQFNKSLSGDGSPKQMHGGANTVRAMAKGKLQGLQGQAQDGMQGKPNFDGATPAPQGGMVTMQSPSGQTKQVPANQVQHYIQLGAKVVK